MIRKNIVLIEVKELLKDFIIEEIEGIRYGYNPKFVDEELLNDIRNTTIGKEVI